MSESHAELPMEPQFPVTVTFEDGSTEHYESIHDLECNLEEFDSSKDIRCEVNDAESRRVVLVLHLLKVREFRIA